MRDENLAKTLDALGHVLHLNQDLSSPDHVRNDNHYSKTWIEEYGRDNYGKNPQWFAHLQNATIGWNNWQSQGFNKLLDFWDRGLYVNGGSQGLNDDAGGVSGKKLGLAEFSNGNFLGEDASYSEFFYPGGYTSADIHYFPFPSLESSTDYRSVTGIGSKVFVSYLKNGQMVNRVGISKIHDGITVTHHSVLNYFGVLSSKSRYAPPHFNVASTVNDPAVLQDYHSILIPKAVEYSTGILDYFFRGTMSAGINSIDTNVPQYTVLFKNTSSQDFYNGTFYIFQNSDTVRMLVAQTNLADLCANGILGTNSSVTATFPGFAPTNTLTIFYQGTIGVSNGVPLDPVDAGIAIAIASYQVAVTANPLWTDSGIVVSNGQILAISASGTWNWSSLCDADGVNDGVTDLFLAGANHGSLIAYVGTHPPNEDSTGTDRWGDSTYFPRPAGNGYWLVGKKATITTDRTGELWFLINDDALTKAIDDNSGELNVTLSIH